MSKKVKSRLRQMDFTFGFWNVLTLNRPGALESLLDVLDGYMIDVTALQEINWTGQGSVKKINHTIYYSCNDTSNSLGTGFVVAGMYRQLVMEFKPISQRICSLRIKDKFSHYTLISCHAPPEASDEDEKKEFYQSLENIIRSSPTADIKIIGGDFDAEVGKEVIHAATIGMHSLHDVSNDNGSRLLDFCASQKLVIGSTIFPHKYIHKGTWYSPDGITVKQVDHLLFSAQHKYILHDVRAYRGTCFASDHYLSTAKIRPMLLALRKKKAKQIKIKKVNTTKLEDLSNETQRNKEVKDLNPLSIDDSNIQQDLKTTINFPKKTIEAIEMKEGFTS